MFKFKIRNKALLKEIVEKEARLTPKQSISQINFAPMKGKGFKYKSYK